MRLFYKGKDGGFDSPVTGYWLIEVKSLISICILKFNKGRRESFHSHAFNALTWFICGDLEEEKITSTQIVKKKYFKSLFPKITKRSDLHRVKAHKDSWCLSIRGPWINEWREFDLKENKFITLTHGRKIVNK